MVNLSDELFDEVNLISFFLMCCNLRLDASDGIHRFITINGIILRGLSCRLQTLIEYLILCINF